MLHGHEEHNTTYYQEQGPEAARFVAKGSKSELNIYPHIDMMHHQAPSWQSITSIPQWLHSNTQTPLVHNPSSFLRS